MMGAHYLCWCLAFLFIPNLDAKFFKLIPGRTKTITTNGITQEISRYMVVPDDQNNGQTNKTIAKAIKLLTANENGVVKALNETSYTTSGNITDNLWVKQNTANETNVENVRNNLIKRFRILRARQDNAGDSKSTETPTLDKYQSFFRSLSNRNNNHSDQDDDMVRVLNTAKNNGRDTVEHTKVTLNLKPQPTSSKSKVVYVKYNNEEKDNENMNAASEFITQNKLERPASSIIWNLNGHTSKSNKSVINNLTAKENLIQAIGINKMFTIPGKRGQLLHEKNDDHDNADQKIYTIHYSGQPKQKTVYVYGVDNIPNQQTYLGSLNFATPTAGSVSETYLDKGSSNRDHNNLYIADETSQDKKYGLKVVTGKMNLLKEDTENEHLDTPILLESQNNFVNTEPTSNETIIHNTQVFRNDLNVLPLKVNNTNSIEIHNTKSQKLNTITPPEAINIFLTTQDSETLNYNADLSNKDSEHNGIFAPTFNNYDPIKENNYPFVDHTIISDNVKKPLTTVVSDYSSDLLNKYEKVTDPKIVISEENAQPTAVKTTVSDDDNHHHISTKFSAEALRNRYENIYPESEKMEIKHEVESVPIESDTNISGEIKEPNFVPSLLDNYNSTTVPNSNINSTTTIKITPILGELNFSNGSSELRDITVKNSTAGVDMKPGLREIENMDAVPIESSSSSSVLYETEKPSIDVVTEPSVELLDDSTNITDQKTDTTIFTTAQIPSKISESNKYKELNDDKKTPAPGKDNKQENKVKTVSNGVEEHSIADVSESSESSEVLGDDKSITVPATRKMTISTVSSESESLETNLSKELEKEAAELVTDKDDKEKTVELPSGNNKTENLKINYAAIPEDNLGFEHTQEDVNQNILINSLEQVNPSLLQLARSPTKHLTETYTLREKLKLSLDVVKQLDDFYHDIHKTTREPDNSNNHKHKPEKFDLNFKLDTPSEALTVEIKQENNIQPSQHAFQPIANDYDGGESQDDENDGSNGMENVYSNYRNHYVISDQYLQKILTFLTSKKVMQLLRLKYDIDYEDTDKIRKSHIVEQLRNLGFDKINPIQVFILSQLVRQIEELNKKDNQKVKHDHDPNSVAKYYYMPYAKIYPIVQFQNDAYQRNLLHNVDVKFYTAIRALVSRAMNIKTYLRAQGVPKYKISFYKSEVHKLLNNNAVQSYLNNCKKKILAGLSIKVDSLARQAMMI